MKNVKIFDDIHKQIKQISSQVWSLGKIGIPSRADHINF